MTKHEVHVEYVDGTSYCWKPACSCGEPMWGYLTPEAAEQVGAYHAEYANMVPA